MLCPVFQRKYKIINLLDRFNIEPKASLNHHLRHNFQGGTLALATKHFSSAVSEICPVVVVALVKMSVSLLLEDLYPMEMAEMIQLNPYSIQPA